MDITDYGSQHFLTLIDCGPTRFTIWRPLVRQDSSNVIHEWGIRLRHQCAYVPSGNGIAERCHRSVKRIAARKACTITEAVYRYNAIPKDAVTTVSAPANAIHCYRVRIKGIDAHLPDWRGTRGPYELGDTVWVKPPNSRCTTSFRRGWIPGIVSEQAVLVDGTPRHVRDARPALNMYPLASSSNGESSNHKLWIQPTPREPDGPTANPDTDANSSDATSESSDEEVQTIPLRRSARNKRTRPPWHMCDLETRGGGYESETNGCSQQKRIHLCLACRAVIWSKGRNTAITVSTWKKRKILTAVSIIHLQPILKEKREGDPKWNFYRLRKWIMGRVVWIKTDQFLRWWLVFFCVSFSVRSRSWSRSREKEKQEKRWKRNERRSTERERERERKGEWGREGGKWKRNAKREVV